MSLSKGIAIVTGAGQGIGRAVALRLAADGFDVAVNDIRQNEAKVSGVVADINATGRRGIPVLADVSKESEVEGMVSEVVTALGGLDVMVANAGICVMKPIFDLSTEEFDRMLSVNLRGTFLCYKYAGKHMVAQGRGGRIIGACSGAGKKGAVGLAGYSSTKFGIRGLTQSAANEFGVHGITVNAYAPGPVKTPMYDDLSAVVGAPPGVLEAELIKTTALKRIGVPEDIAGWVSYIASKDGGIITGQTINVDGGIQFD
ncbi:NAD(P)-binding protein [Auriscalpium vulgare]|uniref:NAD(P)-binding protein n=1 Tax=Auriscalpium vulgare TaxID=40419 RepID=A0ACB8RZ08_9AGAM|nr:NAD(P)-binding protein [Auriscalpium vulgare]